MDITVIGRKCTENITTLISEMVYLVWKQPHSFKFYLHYYWNIITQQYREATKVSKTEDDDDDDVTAAVLKSFN